jgi:DNA polymerase-1
MSRRLRASWFFKLVGLSPVLIEILLLHKSRLSSTGTIMAKVYVDGDVVIFRAAQNAETVCDWGDDLWSIAADLHEGQGHYNCALATIAADLGVSRDDVVICVSCNGPTFRHELHPEYKANRTARKPLIFRALRDWSVEQGALRWDRLEADDVLGILGTRDPSSIIVTIDKDLKSVPGNHWNPDKKELGVVEVSQEDADFFFLSQAIAGDSTDNYKGVPGMGMVRAARLLEKEGAAWETGVSAYEKAGLPESEALLNARMARILRDTDWDAEQNTVNLWSPA